MLVSLLYCHYNRFSIEFLGPVDLTHLCAIADKVGVMACHHLSAANLPG